MTAGAPPPSRTGEWARPGTRRPVPTSSPPGDGEKNEEWIDREPMTDEGRRDELTLQCGDAEIGERRDDCLTERGKHHEADDEERRDDDCGTKIGYEV